MTMPLARDVYRSKVLGCWLGKNIGGTLGAPFEWRRQVNDVSYYTQDLGGEPLPNDDLDIQLLWLVALEEQGIQISSHVLADYWCLYVTPHWCEYGTAKINMRQGLLPPLSGTLHNEYRHSCGAFIRSEVWACICPGMPDLAARYAVEDAMLDHGKGEGTYAEVFVAAMEAAAFVVADLRELIQIGLSYVPDDCGVAQAVRSVVECSEAGRTWLEARNIILERHRGGAFWHIPELVSEEDRVKGFADGIVGYDAPSNIGMTILGLLYGGDDFGNMVCTTVNCGEDTDCTAATAGSIYGLIHGAEAIPGRWVEPIGRRIKTACLNLGELGYFGNQLPQTVDEMTDRTERLARQVLLRHGMPDMPDRSDESDRSDMSDASDGSDVLRCRDRAALYLALDGPRFEFPFFTVAVDHGQGPAMRDGVPCPVRLAIHNTYKVQANLTVRWLTPPDWTVSPAPVVFAMSLPSNLSREPVSLEFEVTCPRVTRAVERAVVEITIEGRPTVMATPITFVNANAGEPTLGAQAP